MRDTDTFKIFVGNVSAKTTDSDLRKLFDKYGAIIKCDVVKDYAFIHMCDEQQARKAIKDLNGVLLHGLALKVEAGRIRRPGYSRLIKIYVGNIGDKTSAAEIRELFEKFGRVMECDILGDFGFVHLECTGHIRDVINELNGREVGGSILKVQVSTTQVRTAPGMGDPGQCYRCGRLGHWSKECPCFPVMGRGPSAGGYRDRMYDRDTYPPPPQLTFLRDRASYHWLDNDYERRFEESRDVYDPYYQSREMRDYSPPPMLYREPRQLLPEMRRGVRAGFDRRVYENIYSGRATLPNHSPEVFGGVVRRRDYDTNRGDRYADQYVSFRRNREDSPLVRRYAPY